MPKKIIIISLGGSLIVPEEIDWKFVKKFKALIEEEIAKGYKFVIITGGGKVCRKYQEAASKANSILTNEDKDWLGIHATRMNAHFIRTVFREHSHPRINKNPYDLEDFKNFKENILVAAGWRPGFSTDFDDYVCDKDPNKFPDAKKIKNISWSEFRKIVGDTWDPGMNAPFDPIASKEAESIGLQVVIMNGKKLANLKKFLEGKEAQGTVING